MNEEVAEEAASCQHWQVCDWWILGTGWIIIDKVIKDVPHIGIVMTTAPIVQQTLQLSEWSDLLHRGHSDQGGQRRGRRGKERAGGNVLDGRSCWSQHSRRCRGLPCKHWQLKFLLEKQFESTFFSAVRNIYALCGVEPFEGMKQTQLALTRQRVRVNKGIFNALLENTGGYRQGKLSCCRHGSLCGWGGILKGWDKSLKCAAVSFAHDLVVS